MLKGDTKDYIVINKQAGASRPSKKREHQLLLQNDCLRNNFFSFK